MTKIALRDWILLITLLPTLLVSIGLGSFFSYSRYSQLAENLADRAFFIAEPLSMAVEASLLQQDLRRVQLLLNQAHRHNAPLLHTIALFDQQHQLIATSNLHKDFAQLQLVAPAKLPVQAEFSQLGSDLLMRLPIKPEALTTNSPIRPATDTTIGYLVLQLDTDSVLLAQRNAILVSVLVTLFSIALALWLALRLLSRLSMPMQQLIQQVDRLVERRYNKQLEQPFVGELELLRLGMNQLTEDLQQQREELQNAIEQSDSDMMQTMEQLEMQNVALDLARRKAQEDNKLKSEFLAKMSHELRTPLNGVIGFTRQLLKTQLNLHQQDYLNTIQKSANSLLSLVNDVLDYSKLEEGRMPINPEPFSLRDLVYDAIELLAVNAYEKQLELTISIDPAVPDNLIGDPLRITQILMNITGNAIKFTEHGSIVVRVKAIDVEDKVQLRVEVEDTGIGISPEQQAQLFQGFAQADGSIGRRYGGTGLGLIISQRLVQAMDGNIGFDSKTAQGSTFWFTLTLPQHSLTISEPLPLAALQGKTVLYLEPQQHSRESVLQLLNSWEMQVAVCAANSQLQQALQQRQHYDIVLIGRAISLDQLNPVIELIRQLKSHCSYIYLLVNSLSPNLREALLQSGAQACLSKPAHQRKLAGTLARPYLEQQPAQLVAPIQPRAQMRVLTVDDNEANLKLINALLGELVEHIDSASHGAEAWQLASHSQYDAIFMDINMPVMDGITACQRIKQSSLNEQTPIIAVTAHALPGERERLLGLGFSEFLSKPLDEQMLQFAMKECCPSFSQRTETMTPAPEEINKLPHSRHVDWAQALQRAAGKVELAVEMLHLLINSLPQTLNELDKYRESNQKDALIQCIHKLHGATCYTGVPTIKQLTELLETSLKTGCSISQLEPELFDLSDQLRDLLEESTHWQRPA